MNDGLNSPTKAPGEVPLSAEREDLCFRAPLLVEPCSQQTLRFPALRHREHPPQAALIRFLAGEATGAERRAVVRHLLAGCRGCLAVARPVWLLARDLAQAVLRDVEPPPRNPKAARTGAGLPPETLDWRNR